MGEEGGGDSADSLLRQIVQEGRSGDTGRMQPARALQDRASIEAFRKELRDLLAMVDAEEATMWRQRLEAFRGLKGEALLKGLNHLRPQLESRRLEVELERAGPSRPEDSRYVMILDRCGHVIASRGDHGLPAYYALTHSLQQTVPKLGHGSHLMSHTAGRVGLVVGEHGAVAASFKDQPSGPGMEVLSRILTSLERRHAGALDVRTAEDRVLIDGYAEATLQLLGGATPSSRAAPPRTGPSGA